MDFLTVARLLMDMESKGIKFSYAFSEMDVLNITIRCDEGVEQLFRDARTLFAE